MVAILPTKPAESDPGNAIVPNPREPIGFPMLMFSALIVGAGIYVVDQISTKGAWLLAFLVLLVIAFGYKDFGDEIVGIFQMPSSGQTAPMAPSGQLMPGQQGPLPVVGPTGNVNETISEGV